ncbi:MAG: cold-shock protein [Mesorhizobium sp.]|nr:MAG: cold-shock protein [Mesorhizobium sp.]
MERQGTVKWYNPEKGFGFIAPENGEKDVFVHATALNRSGLSVLVGTEKSVFRMRAGQERLGSPEFASPISQYVGQGPNGRSNKEKAHCREEVAVGSI